MSVRPALSARRALAVIDLLTADPRVGYSLSELATALAVSPSSLHAVLGTLRASGFVIRHSRRKTYTLGPTAVTTGRAATVANPIIDLAIAEMHGLADRGYDVLATSRVGTEILCVAVAGRPTAHSADMHPGQRVPLVPPLGQSHLAWMDDVSTTEWLRLFPEPLVEEAREWLRRIRRSVRARGYAATLFDAAKSERDEITRALLRRPGDPELRARMIRSIRVGASGCLLDVQPDRQYEVANLNVPIFDEYGTVALALGVYGPGHVTGAELSHVVTELMIVTGALTRAIGGRYPVHQR